MVVPSRPCVTVVRYVRMSEERRTIVTRPTPAAGAGAVAPQQCQHLPLGETLPAPIGQAGEPRKTGLACELLTAIEFKEVAKYILDPDYWLQDKRDGHSAARLRGY